MNAGCLPAVIALVGGLAGLGSARWEQIGARVAVASGWLALIAGAGHLRAVSAGWMTGGVRVAVTGMAAAAPLAVCAPVLGGGRGAGRRVTMVAAGLLAAAGAGASLWVGVRYPGGPWTAGAVLVGAFAASAAAAVAAGAIGLTHAIRAGFDAPSRSRSFEAGSALGRARRFAGAAVASSWLAWASARYLTWRLRGVPSLGSASEWVGLGGLLVVSAAAIVSFDDRSGRGLRIAAAAIVFLILAGAVGVSVVSGVPVGTNLTIVP